jgi:hypothetical protein
VTGERNSASPEYARQVRDAGTSRRRRELHDRAYQLGEDRCCFGWPLSRDHRRDDSGADHHHRICRLDQSVQPLRGIRQLLAWARGGKNRKGEGKAASDARLTGDSGCEMRTDAPAQADYEDGKVRLGKPVSRGRAPRSVKVQDQPRRRLSGENAFGRICHGNLDLVAWRGREQVDDRSTPAT